jgi:hypothetical protein
MKTSINSSFRAKHLFILHFSLLIFIPKASFSQTNWLQDYVKTYEDVDCSGDFIYVSSEKQCLYHYRNWELVASYDISTAKAGIGSESGSNKTPSGMHRIKEKYGDGLEPGAILKSRVFTGKIAKIYTDDTDVEEDHVTTRILWLDGLEPGHNRGKNAEGVKVDSHGRYIYIHGTPEEGLIGEPQSHGCVRMLNKDVIELYDAIPEGTPVLIL